MRNFKEEIKSTKILTKESLIKIIAKESRIEEEEAYRFLHSLFNIIENEVVKGEEISILNFGTFKRRLRKGFYNKMLNQYFEDEFKFMFKPSSKLNDKINKNNKLNNLFKSFKSKPLHT